MLPGRFGYREDTSDRTPARHGRPCKGDLAKQREMDLTTAGRRIVREFAYGPVPSLTTTLGNEA